VEDNLAALRILSQEGAATKGNDGLGAGISADLCRWLHRRSGPYLEVLTAQTIALQNERNGVDILRRCMDAGVLLIKTLGGGWTVSELPKTAELR